MRKINTRKLLAKHKSQIKALNRILFLEDKIIKLNQLIIDYQKLFPVKESICKCKIEDSKKEISILKKRYKSIK